MVLDRLAGDEQGAGHFAVRHTGGDEICDSAFAGREGIDAGQPIAAGSRAGGGEFVAGPGRDQSGPASGRLVERPRQRFPGGGPLPAPAERGADLEQRTSVLRLGR